MSSLALIWDLIARDQASATFKRVGDSAESTAAKTEAASKKIGLFGIAIGAVGAAVAVHAAKMAADFQYQMNRMTTAAGESQKNLKLISNGVLSIMSATGTSAKEAAAGLYLIESAGYHGAAGLKVLDTVAKGAKIENADLATVANAVTSAMVDYHLKADQSARVMNTLIAAVAHGKTTLADLSTAFSNVGAAGAIANIPMADLSAAIATMTMHGTDAAKAGTYLRQVIGQLEAPSAKARKVMEALGLDANRVGQTLSSGPGGLANAIQLLEDAITRHLTPAGLVALETFKKSKDPITAYQKVLADLPPSLVTTFGALAEMTGGVRSLQGFLQLGGENLAIFRANTLAVNEAVKAGGKNIEGWASTQKTFNVQWDRFKESIDAVMIRLGTALLPVLTKGATAAANFMASFSSSPIAHGLLADLKEVWSGLSSFVKDNKDLIVGAFQALAGGLILMQHAFQAVAPFISQHKALFEALVVAVLSGVVAFKAIRGAINAWKDFGKALDVLKANPVILLIAAIAALAAGLVYLYFHSKRARDIMNDIGGVFSNVGKAIAAAAVDTYNAVKTAVQDVVGAYHDTANALEHAFGNVEHAFDNVAHAVSNVLHALEVAWRDTWGAVKAVWDAVSPVLAVIGEIFYAIIGGTVLLAIEGVKVTWMALWAGVKTQWDYVGKPVLDAVITVISFLWNNVVKPQFEAIKLGWDLLWKGQKAVWDTVGKPVFDAIAAVISAWWTATKVIFGYYVAGFKALWDGAVVTWNTIGKPVVDAIGSVFTGLWNDVLKPIFHTIGEVWSDLWNAFPDVIDAVWGKITSIAAHGINDLIDVLNGFVSAIDWILDKLPGGFHIDKIKKIFIGTSGTGASGGAGGAGTHLAFAKGGTVPGYAPGVDSIMALLSPGEGVLVPEATRALGGPAGIHAINSAFSGRVPRFGLGGFVSGLIGDIGGAIKKIASLPAKLALDAAEAPLKAAIGLLPAGVVRNLGKGLFGSLDNGLRHALFDQGGYLMPGVTLAVNNTGRPERVFPTNGQHDKLARGMTVEQLTVQYLGEPPVISQTLPQVQRSLSYQWPGA